MLKFHWFLTIFMFQVLKASHKTNSSNSKTNSSSSKTTNNNHKIVENGMQNGNAVASKRSSEGKTTEPPTKKARILEKIHYEDLENQNKSDDTQELKLSKVIILNFTTVTLGNIDVAS